MEYGSAVCDGSRDRCGSCTGSSPFKAGYPSADDPRSAGRWPSMGEYRLKGLSLPWRPLVREDQSRRVHA